MLEWQWMQKDNAGETTPRAEMEKIRNKGSHHIFVYGWCGEAALGAPLWKEALGWDPGYRVARERENPWLSVLAIT